MAKKVRCISPHGGAHHGLRHNGTTVRLLPDGTVREADKDPATLRVPAHEGGYIDCPSLSRDPIGYGDILDAPDWFIADGFHFEDVVTTPPPPPPAASTPALSAPAPAGEGK